MLSAWYILNERVKPVLILKMMDFSLCEHFLVLFSAKRETACCSPECGSAGGFATGRWLALTAARTLDTTSARRLNNRTAGSHIYTTPSHKIEEADEAMMT
jgi:hypothetical protein